MTDAGADLAGGGHPGAPPGPPAAAGQVARQMLGRDIIELLGYDRAGVLGHGPTLVHEARVAMRRLRSDLDTCTACSTLCFAVITALARRGARFVGAATPPEPPCSLRGGRSPGAPGGSLRGGCYSPRTP